MSHYSVLVVGEDPEAQLAPYHEFECTGVADQYVIEIDKTEEARADYEASTQTRLKRLSDGTLHDMFDKEGNWKPEFSKPEKKDPLFGWSPGRREKFVPPGYEEVEVPTRDVETFAEWVPEYYGANVCRLPDSPNFEEEHKYGYTLLSPEGEVVKVVKRTNPNKKWDWYQLGGRWTGFLKLRPDASGALGEPGVGGRRVGGRRVDLGTADQCLKRDVDVEGMRDEARRKALVRYDRIESLTRGHKLLTWTECAEECGEDGEENFEKTRERFWNQPFVAALKKDRDLAWLERAEIDRYALGRVAWGEFAARYAIVTFAVVMDGKWYERGRMGWWGAVHDDSGKDDWATRYTDLFDSLPDDALLSVYDCHI